MRQIPAPPPWHRDLFTVGVTGTNGKTSTVRWTAALLGELQRPVATVTTVGNYLDDELINLLVLQTGPGLGMALAIRVDRTRVPGVAGTLAGEDTLMVAVAKGFTLAEVRTQLENVLGAPQ